MDKDDVICNPDRFFALYDFLVDETVNPMTYRNREKNQRLSDLLELFEYLMGTYDDNPLDKWFTQD